MAESSGRNPPTVTAGATQVSVSPVNRVGTGTTTISTTFTDADQPAVGSFTVYFGLWLNADIQSVPDTQRRSGLRRFYYYILSLIGLAASFTGLALLVSVVLDQLFGTALWGESLRGRTAGAIATLAVGLTLWLMTWRPMQAEALASGSDGDHARRSLIRRVYLYLVIFASVIGLMVSAITLVYQLLTIVLGRSGTYYPSTMLNALQLLALFTGLLLYHMSACSTHPRSDKRQVA